MNKRESSRIEKLFRRDTPEQNSSSYQISDKPIYYQGKDKVDSITNIEKVMDDLLPYLGVVALLPYGVGLVPGICSTLAFAVAYGGVRPGLALYRKSKNEKKFVLKQRRPRK